MDELVHAVSVLLTTDGWTSRATESYITVTSSHIDSNWKLRSYVLQTRRIDESHTGPGVNITRILGEVVVEWGLPNAAPPLASDNAANMTVAAKEFGTELHMGCFAHTLNLACGRALKIGSVSTLLARIRRVVAYFHHSTTAVSCLKEKQEQLLPNHKLIIGMQTRWNSAFDMVQRFLEQQPAIYAALTSKELRDKEKDISTLSERDITAAEELVVVLEPLKTATTAMCEENIPTIYMVLPLYHQLMNCILKVRADDTELIKQVKCVIVKDLDGRYSNINIYLTMAGS